MRPIKVVAYATNAFYKAEMQKLIRSLEEMMADHCTVFRDECWTWNEAVSWKPEFIYQMLLGFPECDILYTDADSILRRPIPVEELDGVDFGCHLFKRSPSHNLEYLTGTLFFSNTEAVRFFVRDWSNKTVGYRASSTPEQESLRDVIQRQPGIIMKDLGPEWCWVFDDFKEIYGEACRPIFEHFQASRKRK